MRSGDPYQAVGESLQADVMRFMAIIAFCLIAILALVRSVEPADADGDGAVAAARGSAVDATAESPAPAASPPPSDPIVRVRSAPPPAAEVSAPEAPEPAAPAPEPDEPSPVAAVREPAPASVEPPPAAAPEPAAPPAAVPGPASEGLSLRFASDQDFLRLVSRGAIRVFAFNERDVLALDRDFSFQPATPPGEVHELLPETIPQLMSGALARSHGGLDYRWGVAMPERMARQIRGYVDRGATGELVIDRFGEVRHHGA